MRKFLNSRSRRGRYLALTLIGLVWSNSICLLTYSAAKTTAINPAVNKLQPEEQPHSYTLLTAQHIKQATCLQDLHQEIILFM